jgi:hypothetical protein
MYATHVLPGTLGYVNRNELQTLLFRDLQNPPQKHGEGLKGTGKRIGLSDQSQAMMTTGLMTITSLSLLMSVNLCSCYRKFESQIAKVIPHLLPHFKFYPVFSIKSNSGKISLAFVTICQK